MCFCVSNSFQLYVPDLHVSHLHFPSADLACVCTNPTFDQAAIQCIQSNCTSAERTEALQLQVEECSRK